MNKNGIIYWISTGQDNRSQIIPAVLAYVLANIIDYTMTVVGITIGGFQEGNPIVRFYINHFGLQEGILFCKSLMCSLVIIGIMLFSRTHKKRIRLKPEYLLYLGTVLTFLAGISWFGKL